jgi:hypothetical protein
MSRTEPLSRGWVASERTANSSTVRGRCVTLHRGAWADAYVQAPRCPSDLNGRPAVEGFPERVS